MQVTESLPPIQPPGTETGADVSAECFAVGFRARAVLRDGTPVGLRTIRPNDKERLQFAFRHLSPKSVYQRFFHPINELTVGDLRQLTELDFRDHVGLVLTVADETGERLIAVGRFVRMAGGDRAEFAITVADEYQHRGAGTLLLEQLTAIARRCGIREFVGLVLEDNEGMLGVLRNSKLPVREKLEFGIRRVILSIVEPSRMVSG